MALMVYTIFLPPFTMTSITLVSSRQSRLNTKHNNNDYFSETCHESTAVKNRRWNFTVAGHVSRCINYGLLGAQPQRPL